MNILIVEDDLILAKTLKQIAEGEGYITDTVNDGMDGVYYATSNHYDAIILDVMLPKLNGFDVIKMIRAQKVTTPTLMLTAKSEILDKVKGLDAGADDYMTKPFSPQELTARLRALLRRQADIVADELTFEGLTLNLSSYELSFDVKSISLSHKEFQIIYLLMQNTHHIISKETLINKVWGAVSNAEDNNVEAYISFIRKKLAFLRATNRVAIKTIRNAGYKLEGANDD